MNDLVYEPLAPFTGSGSRMTRLTSSLADAMEAEDTFLDFSKDLEDRVAYPQFVAYGNGREP